MRQLQPMVVQHLLQLSDSSCTILWFPVGNLHPNLHGIKACNLQLIVKLQLLSACLCHKVFAHHQPMMRMPLLCADPAQYKLRNLSHADTLSSFPQHRAYSPPKHRNSKARCNSNQHSGVSCMKLARVFASCMAICLLHRPQPPSHLMPRMPTMPL